MNNVETRHYHGSTFLHLPLLAAFPHAFGTSTITDGMLKALGITSDRLVTLTQVHGAEVLVLDASVPDTTSGALHYDAIVTRQRRVAMGIWTADCVPLLLADPVRDVAAAVHAGWRGLTGGIIRHAIATMNRAFRSDPADILAGIGPAIGPCCYEVGPEVATLFERVTDDSSPVVIYRGNRAFLDLPAAARLELVRTGCSPQHIATIPWCTACEPGLFHSYRKQGGDNRQLSCIMLA